MSIFDVLKYPLSTPPTREELEALPKCVINSEISRVSIGNYNGTTSYENKINDLASSFKKHGKVVFTKGEITRISLLKAIKELP